MPSRWAKTNGSSLETNTFDSNTQAQHQEEGFKYEDKLTNYLKGDAYLH
jgi:hypothetical protein